MLDQTTLDLIRNGGTPVLIFFIWYFYHKTQSEAWQKINQQNFEILQKMIETSLVNTGILTKIYEKIITNQWCPVLKKILKDGITEEEKEN